MSSTNEPPAESERVEALLDQLMPRPSSAWHRFLVGLVATATVAALGLSVLLGYLYPRPATNVSYSGNGNLVHVPERNALAVSVYLPNTSRRDVRATSISLDAPGLQLIEAGGRLPAPDPGPASGALVECLTRDDGSEVCSSPAVPVPDDYFAPWPADVAGLPVTIPAGGSVELFLLVEPTACEGPAELPWGLVDVTVDFGPGAFPRWSNTVRLQTALVEDASQAQLLAADRSPAFAAEGDDDAVDGLLAAACRLTGGS